MTEKLTQQGRTVCYAGGVARSCTRPHEPTTIHRASVETKENNARQRDGDGPAGHAHNSHVLAVASLKLVRMWASKVPKTSAISREVIEQRLSPKVRQARRTVNGDSRYEGGAWFRQRWGATESGSIRITPSFAPVVRPKAISSITHRT